MLKSELQELADEQAARIEELEAQVADMPDNLVSGYLVFICDLHTDETHGWNAYRQCFAEAETAIAFAEDEVRHGDYTSPIAQVVELPTGRVEKIRPEREDWRG